MLDKEIPAQDKRERQDEIKHNEEEKLCFLIGFVL